MDKVKYWLLFSASLQLNDCKKKSRIRETPNLLTNADSSTNICFSACADKGALMTLMKCKKEERTCFNTF